MKCKPGDAVVVVGPELTGHIETIGCFGSIVRWVEYRGHLPEVERKKPGVLLAAGGAGWLVELAQMFSAADGDFNLAIYPDRSLMPIRPLADDADTSDSRDIRSGEVAQA